MQARCVTGPTRAGVASAVFIQATAAHDNSPSPIETGTASALAQLNTWTLRTLSFTYTLRASKVIADLLPSTLAMLEQSAPMVKEMVVAAGVAD